MRAPKPVQVGDKVTHAGYMTGGHHGSIVTRVLQLGKEEPKIPGGDWVELDGNKTCWPRFKYKRIK